jgi:hypothetical protein
MPGAVLLPNRISYRVMRKPPCPASIYGPVGLTAFAVAYDAGLFGMPDGFDHSALISISVAASTGTLNVPMAIMNNVTGDSIAIDHPLMNKTVTRSTT